MILRRGLGDFPRRVLHALPLPFTMYDSVTVGEIPANARAVAGYVNGRYRTWLELASSHPHAKRLSIAVSADANAECLDVEQHDARIEQVPEWVRRQQRRGVRRPVVYCSLGLAHSLLGVLEAHGIKRSEIRLWTAHYNDRPHRCTARCGFRMTGTADATQYTDRALGRNLDASRCGPRFL